MGSGADSGRVDLHFTVRVTPHAPLPPGQPAVQKRLHSGPVLSCFRVRRLRKTGEWFGVSELFPVI